MEGGVAVRGRGKNIIAHRVILNGRANVVVTSQNMLQSRRMGSSTSMPT